MTELFEQVKRKCNITWNDEGTNERLMDIIKSAIPKMLKKLGISDPAFDFSTAGAENDLFKNYCFYEFNHCANEFDTNYSNDIAQVRAEWAVKDYQSEVSADEE